MKLIKSLNNSAIIVEDEGMEKVILGKGIGFGLNPGDLVDENKIDRIFSSESEDKKRLISLIEEIPVKYLEISEEIISYARNILNKNLSDNLYISLTDHINFIVDRYERNLIPNNPFKYDIQRFYEEEFKIGKKAVELLEDEFQIKLNDDEAAAIAMHLINAEFEINSYSSIEMMRLIDSITQIIRFQLKINLDEESINYHRLITHLKFFAQRVLANVQYEEDNLIFNIVKENYPIAYNCIERIKEFIEKEYNFEISKDESTYLIIHIQRLMSREKEK